MAARDGLPPGPRAPRAVQAARYTWRVQELTAEQHARHGASWTIRLPGLPATVVTADRELIRQVLTGDPTLRRHANDILEPVLGSEGVMLLEPAAHLERRRLLLPPFHGERIAAYADLMEEVVDRDLATWPSGGPVRVHDHARRITLSIIQEAVLGSRDEAFTGALTRLVDAFQSPVANFGLWAPALAKRSRWNLAAEPFHRRRDQLDALMARQIDAARGDPRLEDRDDVLAMLVLARDEDGEGLSDTALNDELKALLIAGHETTATAIAWAADLLAHRPEAVEAIRAGDRAHLGAAVKEVLRLRTVAPISVARTLLEPAPAGEWLLPAGTVVAVDAHTLHHDGELFEDPEELRPERFLDGGPPQYAYLPFGGGAHRCLGAALATLEMEIALRAITERFDLRPAGPPERPLRRGPTLVPAKRATVIAARRSR